MDFNVSVCVPVFNGGKYLIQCLSSIVRQTKTPYEVLISDDGSDDDSLQIIKSFAEKFEGTTTKVFRNSKLGIAENCNFLVNNASGNFIKFVFQDDCLDESCLETFCNYLIKHNNVEFAFSRRGVLLENPSNKICIDIYNGCKDLHTHWSSLKEIQNGLALLEDPKIFTSPINKIGEPSNTLIKRNLFLELGGFDEKFVQLIDIDFWLRILSKTKVLFVNQELSSFRVHEKQKSVENLENGSFLKDFIFLYEKIILDDYYFIKSSKLKKSAIKQLLRIHIADKVDLKEVNFLKEKINEFITNERDYIQKLLSLEKMISKLELSISEQKNYNSVLINDISNKSNLIHELTESLSNKVSRIEFIESTIVWKFRRFYMKFYKLYKKLFSAKNITDLNKNYKSFDFDHYEPLYFNENTNPLISIVIPFYNQHVLTYLCLKSIFSNTSNKFPYEIILVDDASEPNNLFQDSLHGVKLIKNHSNLGFLKSSNKGALHSSGKYLLFLNNDTQVQEGWLEELVETIEKDENVGAVGSKLIYPNLILQEAGAIVWKDASGCNYGRGEDPSSPEYSYIREVDYCSGASLLVEKKLFENLDYFSLEFIPAYYEDTDLCFKIREKGLKVMFNPFSQVIHCEGATGGVDVKTGVKSFQVKNRVTFQSKWKDVLDSSFESSSEFCVKYKAANRLRNKKVILFIDSYVPLFDRESGSQRLIHIVKIFINLGFHVIFIPDNQSSEEPYTSFLQKLGVEVLTPYESDYELHIQLGKRLKLIDLAWICRPQLFEKYYRYFDSRFKGRLVYDTIDLHFLRVRRQWELGNYQDVKLKKKWNGYEKLEKTCCAHADLTITVTEEEKKIINSWGYKCEVVPNIHISDTKEIPNFYQRNDLLFIGGYNHPPNVDACLWLIEEIMPLVWAKYPNLLVTLLGSNPEEKISNLISSRVKVPGYISDVSNYFNSAKVFVAPLRYGAGMKGKIGQSLAYGLPTVTTSIGAEGMGLDHLETAIIANDTNSFVEGIFLLLEDEELWSKLSGSSVQHIQKYSPKSVESLINNITKDLIPHNLT